MAQEQKFFICRRCGNVVGLIHNGGAPLRCCGEEMEELISNTADGAVEKHKPVVRVRGGAVRVDVGEDIHPMTADHSIGWVYVQTARGGQRKSLQAGDPPTVDFGVTEDDQPQAVFAYCNLHGLWKTIAGEFQR